MSLLLALVVAVHGLADRPPRCEALYQEGRRLYFEGRFAEARAGFREAQECARVEEGREDTLSLRYEGLCFQYEDRLDEALALFRVAATEIEAQERAGGREPPLPSPSLADALNNVGRLLFLQGQYAAARAELEKALALAPDAPEDREGTVWVRGRVRTNLAIVTAALGDAASAHRTLGEVAATPARDRMNRTRALEHLGRLEESWGDLEAALARYEEALATGEAALRDDAPVPYNRAYLVGALSRLGSLYERLGRKDAARAALDRALATARELGTRQLVAEVLLDRGTLAREGRGRRCRPREPRGGARHRGRSRTRGGPRARRARLGPARGGRREGRARPLRAGARLEGREGRARDRGRPALGTRAGPRDARGDRPGRRARTTRRSTRSSP